MSSVAQSPGSPHTNAYRFAPGTRFEWEDSIWKITHKTKTGLVNLEDAAGILEDRTVPATILVRAFFGRELRPVESARALTLRQGGGAQARVPRALDDVPEPLVAAARFKMEVLRPLIAERGLAKSWPRTWINERITTVQKALVAGTMTRPPGCGLTADAVYRWRDLLRHGTNTLHDLIPRRDKEIDALGGKGQRRLDHGFGVVIEAVLDDPDYRRRESVSVDDVWQEVHRRIADEYDLEALTKQLREERRDPDAKVTLPARATIGRHMLARDPIERYTDKHGERAAQEHFAARGKAKRPTRPLERVEIDFTTIDLLVIDERGGLLLGRLTLTFCIDCCTRYPLGYYLGWEPFSYLAVMQCLYHAILPKFGDKERYGSDNEWRAYGKPVTLVVDNGKAFIGHSLQNACDELGIILQRAPVRAAHFKGRIERFFRTGNTKLFHGIGGTTFSNVRQRGDYKSEDKACLYARDVDLEIHIFVVDQYAEEYHRGLRGVPARRWDKAWAQLQEEGLEPDLLDPDRLRIALAAVTTRRLEHYGIDLFGMVYNSKHSDPLATLRSRLQEGEKSKIKYHPGDLSVVHIYDRFSGEYIALDVEEEWAEHAREMALWQHKIIRKAARLEEGGADPAALGRVKFRRRQRMHAAEERKTTNRKRDERARTRGAPARDMDQAPTRGRVDPETESVPIVPVKNARQNDLNALLAGLTPQASGWRIGGSARPGGHDTTRDGERGG